MAYISPVTTLLLIFFFCSTMNQAASVVYIATIPSIDLCPTTSCLTLSKFATNSTHYLGSNITLLFLPGTHYLNTTNLTLSSVDNVVMKSINSTIAQIQCANNSHINFNQSESIYIANLDFIGCVGNEVKQVEIFVAQYSNFNGQNNRRSVLELTDTTAQIINCTFTSSYGQGSHLAHTDCAYFDSCFSSGFTGGAVTATNSTIDISQCKFENFEADFGGAIFAEAGSIINMTGTICMNNIAINGGALYSIHSDIIMEECEFHKNIAYGGGVLYSNASNITVGASKFRNNVGIISGGVLHNLLSDITITASEFYGSSALQGGSLYSSRSIVNIETSEFHDNTATDGGVLYSTDNDIRIQTSEFHHNSAINGGVLHSSNGDIMLLLECKLHDNSATNGGVLYQYSFIGDIIVIAKSEFHSNSATRHGGVLDSNSSPLVLLELSEFFNNSADRYGGVVHAFDSRIETIQSAFRDNSASWRGGVLYSLTSDFIIGDSNFTSNGSPIGAVLHATDSYVLYHSYLLIDSNSADSYAVIYLSDSEFSGYATDLLNNSIVFSSNMGSLLAFSSNISFIGYAVFVNNQPPQNTTLYTTQDFQEGGAITLFQSNAVFNGACNLKYNHAENGGAIHSTESKLYLNGNVMIAHNTVTGNGGGIYLSTRSSELICQQRSTLVLLNNTALNKGGGLHATSSSIRAISAFTMDYTGTRIHFRNNTAKRGGGLSLEANARLLIEKYDIIDINDKNDTNTTVFVDNRAEYGGAIHVDDDTNSAAGCDTLSTIECFFQVRATYDQEEKYLKTQSMYFSQNYAKISGSTLYGGLLDRCAVSQLAEVYKKYNIIRDSNDQIGDGVAYFKNVSIITANTSVSSQPVRVCLCVDNIHNCTHQSRVQLRKGEMFTQSVVAVDQIGQPVSAIIQSSLHFTESGLAEGQLARKIPAECTNLTFNIVSPHSSEMLTLYALDGPCRDAEPSRKMLDVHFLPCSCPIGLQISGKNTTNCTCQCHSDIREHVEHCDVHTGALFKPSRSRAWISYINDTNTNKTAFLVYSNCPFDYCLSISPPIDLSQLNGADVQCASKRSSLLCGSCQPGLSLSLGSSHCLSCPSYWPALLVAITIAAILAGVALVASLLILNMTIAVGTLNGLIFYSNVVYVNKNILLPFQETNFITVFISWLNLELGIDTCYFPGMDTYIKTWLQLAFPAYIILLVAIVIIISYYSTKFSNLIGKKDPVATLATLILLSYAKLLEISFQSLSVGILEYLDSSKMVWLPDATVGYLSGKHIPLFIAAVLILLVGLVYTVLLFSWQWLLYLPKWKILRWSRNPKIQTFIETYHKPYTPRHRYWTGLLLIVRIVLYLVAAVNISNDPTVALTAITFTMCVVLSLSKLIGGRTYRKWPIDMLETFFYLNTLSFAIFTWYSLDSPASNQEAAAYTSVTITFIALLLIILYHIYTYTSVFSKIKTTKLGRRIDRLFTNADPKPKPERRRWSSPPDDDIHRFNELLDAIDRPANTYDYNVQLKQNPVKPTQSTVEVHHPYLTPPHTEEMEFGRAVIKEGNSNCD